MSLVHYAPGLQHWHIHHTPRWPLRGDCRVCLIRHQLGLNTKQEDYT